MDKRSDRIFDEVIIPGLRGLFIGIPVSLAISLINTWKWGLFWGIIVWSVITFFDYNAKIPKKFLATQFIQGKKTKEQPAFQSSSETYSVQIWGHNAKDGWGITFNSPISPEKLARIGWHITFLNGRISHAYLYREWGILNDDEVTSLQYSLIEGQWGKFKGQQNKGGLKLTEEAILFFNNVSREYRIPTTEEKYKFNQIMVSPSPTQKVALARWATNRDVRQIDSCQIV